MRMNTKYMILLLTTFFLFFIQISVVSAETYEILGGDEGTACQAILCLSTLDWPSECTPALKKLFSIKLTTWWDTKKARRDFLGLCPQNESDLDIIVNGAGRCDAQGLNKNQEIVQDPEGYHYEIIDELPTYCSEYYNYLGIVDTPVYIGTPESGGYWENQ